MTRPLAGRIRQLEWKLEEKDEIIINLQKEVSKLRSRPNRQEDEISRSKKILFGLKTGQKIANIECLRHNVSDLSL
jgi:predicted nuclease with TOPRIM domain